MRGERSPYDDAVLRLVGALVILCILASGARAQQRPEPSGEPDNKPLITPDTQAGKSVPVLLEQLTAYEPRTRYRARRELRDRNREEVIAAIDAWLEAQNADEEHFAHRACEAMWVLESFRALDEKQLGRGKAMARGALLHHGINRRIRLHAFLAA